MKRDLAAILAELVPMLQKQKPMEHRSGMHMGKPRRDTPSEEGEPVPEAEMAEDADEAAKQKVILMMLSPEEDDKDDEEYC